jgi:UDP-glucose/iron transport system permease protein
MNVIPLNAFDLAVAATLVLALAGLSVRMHLGVASQLLVAAVRTAVQLLLIGMVLKVLFDTVHPGLMAMVALIMTTVAGREVMGRQKRRFRGWWGFGVGTLSMTVSSVTITVLTLVTVIGVEPWYAPRYAIPLLGMMLGNTMTGIAIGLDRLTHESWQHRDVIEARLMLGHPGQKAIEGIRNESIRSGLIPMINAMAVAGLVSLPGMMTGQILGGSSPEVAVRYQILIMFIIGAGTGFGTIAAVWMGSRRLFDTRQRLRLDRLR